MELVGEEKRIQALFSELRFEDRRSTPRFAVIWNRALAESAPPRSAFILWFVPAAFVVCMAAAGLALWSGRRQQTQQPNGDLAVTAAPPRITRAPATTGPPLKALAANKQRRVSRNSYAAKFVARRRAELLIARRTEIRDAAEISSWRSPTATLLSSQNDVLLKSLPQLSESINELKTSLSKISD